MDSRPADLRFTTRRTNGHQVVTVAGEIDICTGPALNDHLLTAAGNGGALVVDLSAVTFMDASGLRVLLRADRRARQGGGCLRLAAPTARIARLLAITRLNLHFDLYATSEAATADPASVPPRPDRPVLGESLVPPRPAAGTR